LIDTEETSERTGHDKTSTDDDDGPKFTDVIFTRQLN